MFYQGFILMTVIYCIIVVRPKKYLQVRLILGFSFFLGGGCMWFSIFFTIENYLWVELNLSTIHLPLIIAETLHTVITIHFQKFFS